VVVGISGAIAATHAPALITALQRRGHTVEVALTATAQRFVSLDALGAIAGREIHTSIWPSRPHAPAPHVALAQWADLVIIYPASATTIGRIANGDFSDLVAAIALTTRAPVVVAPSMNLAMLDAPAVQRNLAQLRADGVVVLHGVPSQEVAEAPSARTSITGAAAAPGEVAATVDCLRAAEPILEATVAKGSLAWASPGSTTLSISVHPVMAIVARTSMLRCPAERFRLTKGRCGFSAVRREVRPCERAFGLCIGASLIEGLARPKVGSAR
jgi:phosphopantothenoylcysteine decarboxylase/phosphopantothenate--cysteine ligase